MYDHIFFCHKCFKTYGVVIVPQGEGKEPISRYEPLGNCIYHENALKKGICLFCRDGYRAPEKEV